ncbi:MAG: heavy-metal-associated domain-containing protein [Firmicutes bacterium]|nr:heavy-metal-associated domain-containing protein [Bacillota bacterium]
MIEKKKIRIEIGNMKCEGCMKRVFNVLNSLKEVEDCQMDFNGATIQLRENIAKDILKEKIEALGFSVIKMSE